MTFWQDLKSAEPRFRALIPDLRYKATLYCKLRYKTPTHRKDFEARRAARVYATGHGEVLPIHKLAALVLRTQELGVYNRVSKWQQQIHN